MTKFFKATAQFYNSNRNIWDSISPFSETHNVVYLFDLATIMDMKKYLIVILISISLMTNDIEHNFFVIISHLYMCFFFLRETSILVLCPFLNCIICKSSLFWILSLTNFMICKYFLLFCKLTFRVFFFFYGTVQNFEILMKSILFFSLVNIFFLYHILRSHHLPNPISQLCFSLRAL